MMHRRRFTRAGVQCSCGSTHWSPLHVVRYELGALRGRFLFRWYSVLWKLGVWVPPTATVRYWSKDWKLLGTDHGRSGYYRNPLPAWRAKVLRKVLSHMVPAVDCTSGQSSPSIDGDHAVLAEGLLAGPLLAGTTGEGHVVRRLCTTYTRCLYPIDCSEARRCRGED